MSDHDSGRCVSNLHTPSEGLPGDHHHIGRERPHAVAVGGAPRDPPFERLVQPAQGLDRHVAFVDVAQDGSDEDSSLALPARRRRFEVARRAVLAHAVRRSADPTVASHDAHS